VKKLNLDRLLLILRRFHQAIKSQGISLEAKPARYLRDIPSEKRKATEGNLQTILLGVEEAHQSEKAKRLLMKIAGEAQFTAFDDWNLFRANILELFSPSPAVESVSSTAHDFACLAERWSAILKNQPRWSKVATLYGEPIPIQDLYVELYLTEEEPIERGGHSAEAYFEEQLHSSTDNIKSLESIIARIQHRALIIGPPGSGKSTLSKWVCHFLQRQFSDFHLLPILVQLRDFAGELLNNPNLSIPEFFLKSYCGYPVEIIRELLPLFSPGQANRILFILDGWDEVPTEMHSQMAAAIEKTSLSGKILVTSRPSGSPLKIATHADFVCRLGSLTHFAIRTLVNRLCRNLGREERAFQLLEQIEHYPQLRRLAGNPFSLTLLTQFACTTDTPISELRNSTDLFSQAVEMIRRDHNALPHLPELGQRDLAELGQIAFDLSFAQSGKTISFSPDDLSSGGLDFPDGSLARSRFLTKTSELDELFCFLHLQLQEFFAGQTLSDLSPAELEILLQEKGMSWEFLEEWRFAAGTLDPDSSAGRTFWRYWLEQLEKPDLFNGVFCYFAYLLAEAPQAIRENYQESVSQKLWHGVIEDGWRDPSIQALVALNPYFLAKMLKESRCADTLKRVFSLMPQGLQDSTGLTEWLSMTEEVSWMLGTQAPSLLPPKNLEAIRSIIRDPGAPIASRYDAFQMISGYLDEVSIDDATALLHSEDESVYTEAAHRLGKIGGSEAAMILSKKLISESKQKRPRIGITSPLVDALSASAFSALEAHSRDYLLRHLHPENPDHPTTKYCLEALRQCPLGNEAEPIVQILESDTDQLVRQAAANALARCSSPRIIDRCIEVAKNTENTQLQSILLRCLVFGKPDLRNHFDWIMTQLEAPEKGAWVHSPLFELLKSSHLNSSQSERLSRLILPTLRNLDADRFPERDYSHLGAISLLKGEDLKEAQTILRRILSGPEEDLSNRHQAIEPLAGIPSPENTICLVETLRILRSSEHRQSNDSYFERSLIRAVLRVSPESLFAEGWTLKDQPRDTLFLELREWSETSLHLIH